jgi:hypothetical protein
MNSQPASDLCVCVCVCVCLSKFNCYWLDPTDPESFPPGLLTALEDLWIPPAHYIRKVSYERGDSVEARLRSQMQADALQPLPADDDNRRSVVQATEHWAEETLSDVGAFLNMKVCLIPLITPPPPESLEINLYVRFAFRPRKG